MSGFDVKSAVGWRSDSDDPAPIPLVIVDVTGHDGERLTVKLLPVFARRVGLDLIAAGSVAVAEASIRAWARQHGQDGDTVIAWMKTGMTELLDSEGEP